jgi:uncharacterized protein (TIGR03437 family)
VFVFGGQNAAAVHADGSLVCAAGSIAGASCRPAAAGETIELFMTGLGTNLSPPAPDGILLPSASTLLDPVTVTLGGAACPVLYQGLVSPGLYQINLQIPEIAAGNEPLMVSAGGPSSQAGPIVAVR